MSDIAEKIAALPRVLVKEAETFPFPDLQIQVAPLEIVQPADIDVPPPPDLPVPPAQDETYVTDGDQQRLIHYWLVYGPREWAASVVEQEPVTPSDPNAPTINPVRGQGSLFGRNYDGVRRVLRLRS